MKSFPRILLLLLFSIAATNLAFSQAKFLQFNGNQSVNAGDDTAFDPDNFTFEAWVNPCSISLYDVIGGKVLDGSWSNGYLLWFSQDAKLNANWSPRATSTTSLTVGEWTHVAMTFDGDNISIFINGVMEGTTAAPNYTPDPGTFNIGSDGGPSYHFNGSISDVRLWSTARSESDIMMYMGTRLSGTEDGLVAYFPLNDGACGGDNSGITEAEDKAGGRNGSFENFDLMGTYSNYLCGSAEGVECTISDPPIEDLVEEEEPLEEVPMVYFSLDDCWSRVSDGSGMDYSEFIADENYSSDCGAATVSGTLFRDNAEMNAHSCTEGVEGSTAMCVSSMASCDNNPGSDASVVFEVDVNPAEGNEITITKLMFYEAAPETFNWIDGDDGPNNYPTLYSVRILIDGVEAYSEADIPTSTDWTLEEFDLTGMDIAVTEASTIRVELLGYCPVGADAPVSAWDLDEIRVYGTCGAPAASTRAAIAGEVITENGSPIVEVMVTNSSTELREYPLSYLTDVNGSYAFNSNPMGYDYNITGEKEGDDLNGVTTLDLVTILRHIIGAQTLDTPYKLIAADIDNNGKVSANDLLELRRTILGVYPDFPNNKSWKFVDQNETVIVDTPMEYQEVMEIQDLEEDLMDSNLIGVKIGDVNNSNDAAIRNAVSSRSATALNFNITNLDLSSTHDVHIAVSSNNFNEVLGFQLALDMNDLELKEIRSGALNVNESHFNIINGNQLLMSWNASSLISAGPAEILFTLVVNAASPGKISEKIALSQSTISNEAYTGTELNISNIDLNFTQDASSNLLLYQNNPNPFIDRTEINFFLPEAGSVTMTISDLSGKVILRSVENYNQGLNTVKLTDSQLDGHTGILLFNMSIGTHNSVIKMLKL